MYVCMYISLSLYIYIYTYTYLALGRDSAAEAREAAYAKFHFYTNLAFSPLTPSIGKLKLSCDVIAVKDFSHQVVVF